MGAAESSLNDLCGCGGAPPPVDGLTTVKEPRRGLGGLDMLIPAAPGSPSDVSALPWRAAVPAAKSDPTGMQESVHKIQRESSHKIPLMNQASFCSKAHVRERKVANDALGQANAELKRINDDIKKLREEQKIYDARVRQGQSEDKEADARRQMRHDTLMARCAEVQKVVRRSTDELEKAEQNLLSGTGETTQRAAPAFFRVKADDRKSSPPPSARGTSPKRCARPSSPTRPSSTKRNSRD